ncbi:MAG: Ger(x)C family spore germination protein [Bacteroidetes bacterium]|nr:MAG: Ger(x)C family spore germination protein [Bacteroidota bacterium]
MKKKPMMFFIFVLSMFLLTGCWDSMELNDRAIELAWGIDKDKNGSIKISTQVIIPSNIGGGEGNGVSGGSKGKSFFVETGIGKDTLEAVDKMQTKLSRQIFRGQRRIILIGESMGRKGIKDILDTYTRDPSINLLTDIFIVKGGTAQDFLKTTYPLENIPAIGAIKEYNQIGSQKTVSFLNFLLAANSEGNCPIMPSIVFGSTPSSTGGTSGGKPSDSNGFRIGGIGIFNKNLKLIGFLNVKDSKTLRWVTGKLKNIAITSRVPNEKGYLSLDVNKLESKIQPVMQRQKIKILVTLSGQGAIRENNTGIDLTEFKNIAIVQKVINREVEKNVLKTITKIQKNYGKDVFEFSDAIQRKDLNRWKSLKKNWDNEFPKVEVSVKANLTIRRIGVTGRSLVELK